MAEIYLLTFPYKRLAINVISLIVGLVLRRLCIKYGIFKMGREVPSVTVNKLTKLFVVLVKFDIIGNAIAIVLQLAFYGVFAMKGLVAF